MDGATVGLELKRDVAKSGEVVKRVLAAALNHGAAQLAYYCLFATFPLLLMVVSIADALPIDGVVADLLDRAHTFLPSQSADLLEQHMKQATAEQHYGLFSVGVALTLWSSSRAIDSIRESLNRASGLEENRPYLKRQAISISVTVTLILLAVACIALTLLSESVLGWASNKLGLGAAFEPVWHVLRWALTGLLVLLGMALVYGAVPNRPFKFQPFALGTVLAALAAAVASFVFTHLAGRVEKFNIAYGSIGGVLALLMWFYLMGLIFLIGGEVNAVFHEEVKAKPKPQ